MASDALKSLRDRLKKTVKGRVYIDIMSESEIASRDTWLKTPSYDLNRVLSGDLNLGLPTKCWCLIVGPEHSFKSSFACLTLAEAQKKGYTVVVVDTEGAWTPAFCKRWGLDPEEILYIYSPFIDEIKTFVAQLIEDPEVSKMAIALDSIGGITREKVMRDAVDGEPKQDQGGLQKDLKDLYKLLLFLIKSKNSILVSTGHLFGKPGSYGPSEDIGGGKFLKYVPDIIVNLKKEKIKEGSKKEETVVGNRITAITLKNRIYPPFNEATIDIDYVKGINRFAGLVDICVEAGIFKRTSSAWYEFEVDGEVKKINGAAALLPFIEENENTIIPHLNEWIKKSGFSTVNENVKAVQEALVDAEAAGEDSESIKQEVEHDDNIEETMKSMGRKKKKGSSNE